MMEHVNCTMADSTSRRIGNLVSAWWFGAQPHRTQWFVEGDAMSAGGGEAVQYAGTLAPMQAALERSFGYHLTREGARRVGALPSACLEQIEQRWLQPEHMHQFFVTPHRLYSTPLLTACAGQVMRQLSADVGRRLADFLRGRAGGALCCGPPQRPTRAGPHGSFAHCDTPVDTAGREWSRPQRITVVVHYRVGDYLSLPD